MRRCLRTLLLLISLLMGNGVFSEVHAQRLYPTPSNPHVRASATIEMGKGYVSGLCIMHLCGDTLRGSIFNEFGISAIDFEYRADRDRVRLLHVVSQLDKRFVRRTLRADLRQWLHALAQGQSTYHNQRRKITYTLAPLAEGTNE